MKINDAPTSHLVKARKAALPKDAGYLAHQAETLAQQLEILHVFAFQNPESCNPALAGAIGLALNAAASLSRELDILEEAAE